MSRLPFSSPRGILLLGLAALLALPGCGDAGAPEGEPFFERLELVPLAAPPAPPRPELVQSWNDLGDPGTWSSWDFGGARHRVVRIDDQPVLVIDRRGDAVVEIPSRRI